MCPLLFAHADGHHLASPQEVVEAGCDDIGAGKITCACKIDFGKVDPRWQWAVEASCWALQCATVRSRGTSSRDGGSLGTTTPGLRRVKLILHSPCDFSPTRYTSRARQTPKRERQRKLRRSRSQVARALPKPRVREPRRGRASEGWVRGLPVPAKMPARSRQRLLATGQFTLRSRRVLGTVVRGGGGGAKTTTPGRAIQGVVAPGCLLARVVGSYPAPLFLFKDLEELPIVPRRAILDDTASPIGQLGSVAAEEPRPSGLARHA